MNDTLLDRYLQAIGKYLPEATRADTLAELRANLLERIDAQEEQLGRPLVDAEITLLLREFGKPESIALRYLPQRSLIGPEVFPFYAYTLRKIAPLFLLAYTITRGAKYATLAHAYFWRALGGYAFGLLASAFSLFASITIAFAVIDHLRNRPDARKRLTAWNPSDLPHVERSAMATASRSPMKRVLDLSIHCLWFAYVLWLPWHPLWRIGLGTSYLERHDLVLAPVWHTFYLLLIVLLSIQLVMKVLAFLPSLAQTIRIAELGTGLLGLLLIGLLAHSAALFVAANAGANMQQVAHINHSVVHGFRIVFLLGAFGLLKSIWRFARPHFQHRQFAF